MSIIRARPRSSGETRPTRRELDSLRQRPECPPGPVAQGHILCHPASLGGGQLRFARLLFSSLDRPARDILARESLIFVTVCVTNNVKEMTDAIRPDHQQEKKSWDRKLNNLLRMKLEHRLSVFSFLL